MATKKKPFDAVAESRRWRVQTARRLAAMTPEERREHLRRTTEAFFAQKPKTRATVSMISLIDGKRAGFDLDQ